MLDLNKIEKKIDDLLAKETSESLRNWFDNQPKISSDAFLGEEIYFEGPIPEITDTQKSQNRR